MNSKMKDQDCKDCLSIDEVETYQVRRNSSLLQTTSDVLEEFWDTGLMHRSSNVSNSSQMDLLTDKIMKTSSINDEDKHNLIQCASCHAQYHMTNIKDTVEDKEYNFICRICRLEASLLEMRMQITELEEERQDMKNEIFKLHQNNAELKWKCNELEGTVEYLESNIEKSQTAVARHNSVDFHLDQCVPVNVDTIDWIDSILNYSPNIKKQNLCVPSWSRSSSSCSSIACNHSCDTSCKSKDNCCQIKNDCCQVQENVIWHEQSFGNKVLIIGCSVIKYVWGGGVKNMARQSIDRIDIKSFNGASLERIADEAIKLIKDGEYKGILVHAGGNDLVENSSAELVSHKVGAMLERIKAVVPKGTKIMYSSILPRSGMSWEWNRKTNVTNCCCMRICQVRGFAFLDNYSVFWTDGGVNKDLLARDGVHLSKLGSRALATNFSVGIRVLFCKDSKDSRVVLPRK